MGHKLTRLNIWSAATALKRLVSGKKFTGEVYWNLVDYTGLVYSTYDKLTDTRNMMVAKHMDPLAGNDDPEAKKTAIAAFTKEWEEFINGEVEIPVNKPEVPRNEVDLKICSPDDIVIMTVNNLVKFSTEKSIPKSAKNS